MNRNPQVPNHKKDNERSQKGGRTHLEEGRRQTTTSLNFGKYMKNVIRIRNLKGSHIRKTAPDGERLHIGQSGHKSRGQMLNSRTTSYAAMHAILSRMQAKFGTNLRKLQTRIRQHHRHRSNF